VTEPSIEQTITQKFSSIQIILVETQDGANIGSVCRAMKTMGLHNLVITGTKKYKTERVKTLAIHAYDIYENSQRYETLKEAVIDSTLIIGATRRRGKFRKYFSMNPDQLAEKIDSFGPGKISIVFGREADGLTDDELNLCNAAVQIPTSPDFPSLNLSQAVQIITYSLYKKVKHIDGYEPITQDKLEQLVSTITDSFDDIHFFKQDEKDEVGRFFRDILARSGLSESESKRLDKMFRKMAAVSKYKKL
jgi:tRNA/rRNA methyltransferase